MPIHRHEYFSLGLAVTQHPHRHGSTKGCIEG